MSLQPGERTVIGNGVVIVHLGDMVAVYHFDKLVRLRKEWRDAYEDAKAIAARGRRVRR